MTIKPIKTERDYRSVLKQIDRLMDAKADTPEGDMLDVLATLAEAWEEKHFPIQSPDPVEAIRFAMEQRGLSRRQLEPLIGSRARVAEVLNHKRPLTLAMIRRLHEGLGIPAEVLIRQSAFGVKGDPLESIFPASRHRQRRLGEQGRFVVADDHRLPEIDVLQLVAVIHLDAGAADQVL